MQQQQWVVWSDPEQAKQVIQDFAVSIGEYYRAVLQETNNQKLAEALTIEYQRGLMNLLALEQNRLR